MSHYPRILAIFTAVLTGAVHAAESASYAAQILDHDVRARIEQGSQGPEFVLEYTNPEKMKLEAWRVARMRSIRSPESQEGDRSSWRRDVAYVPQDYQIRLNFKNGFDENWKRLEDVDPEIWDKPEVKKLFTQFARSNEKKFRALDNEESQRFSRPVYGATARYLEAAKIPAKSRTDQQNKVIQDFNAQSGEQFERPLPLKRSADFVLDQHALIAVHGEKGYDPCKSTKTELNRMIGAFKDKNRPVVFLASDGNRTKGSWISRRDADHVLFSMAGEHDIPMRANEVTITGGYLNNCLNRAMQETARQYFRTGSSELTINVPLASSFSHDPTGKGCPINLDELKKKMGEEKLLRLLVPEVDPNDKWASDDLFGGAMFGRLKSSDFSVEVFVDGKPSSLPTQGNGPKKIRLQLWSAGTHPVLRGAPAVEMGKTAATR